MRVTRTAGRSALATVAAGMLIITACGSDNTDSSASSAGATSPATAAAAGGGSDTTAAGGGGSATTAAGGGAADLSALYDACKAEGQVNLIALPDEWANYKGILQSFRDKYPGVNNPVASPEFSSQEELDAIKNLAGQKDMPDSIDVSPAKAQDAITAGYFEPFQPSTWDQIPDGLKDAAGNWVGAYYGIMALTTNTTIVPNAAEDVRRPEEARVQGQGGAQRRSAQGRRSLRRRDGRVAGQRWQPRRHHAGNPVLR